MSNIEDFLVEITLPAFLSGLIFIAVALITYRFPPKKINDLYGYRTASSMKSQERWDFAQRYSSGQMIKGGLMLIGAAIAGYFIPISYEIKIPVGIGLIILVAVYLIVTTERAIKKKFPES